MKLISDLDFGKKLFLSIVKNKKSKEEIQKVLGIRKNMYIIIEEELLDLKLIRIKNNCIFLTKKGLNILKKYNWDKDMSYKSKKYNELEKYAQELHLLRKKANVLCDQCPVTSDSLLKRIIYFYENGDIQGKKILCIGDNDLASLLMCKTGAPREVVVLDFDDDVIKTIITQSKKNNFPIRIIKFDIRKLPQEKPIEILKEKFDVFQTDPPYTEVGMIFFASIGLSVLRTGGIVYIIHPHLLLERWSDEAFYKLQLYLLHQGIVFT